MKITSKMKPYVIGSAWWKQQSMGGDYGAFEWIWWNTNMKHATGCRRVYVLDHTAFEWEKSLLVGPRETPNNFPIHSTQLTVIPGANLGHVHQYIGAQRPALTGQLCGWSSSVVLLASIALNCRCDFYYVEQDVFMFGDVLGEIDRQAIAQGKQMMFGSNGIKGVVEGVAQSVFLVRWEYLPQFIRDYLSLWPDTEKTKRTEGKFAEMERRDPKNVGRFSFGCDRARPLPYDEPIWYGQHFDALEMVELKNRKLI